MFRSKSGGAHVFMFFTVPVKAGLVQSKLKEFASFLGCAGSEIFPKQNEIDNPRYIGNFVYLPYYAGFDTPTMVAYRENGKYLSLEEFLEYAKVFNNYYGTTRTPVINKLNKGKNVLFDIDWQGADQIKNKKLDYKLITFFILPPSKEVLFERLSNRDMKDKLIAEERMKQFSHDVLHWINYDYVIINQDLEKCYSKIYNLIQAEINNGSKDYDPQYIRKHIEKLTS